jgi:hypothetical protein
MTTISKTIALLVILCLPGCPGAVGGVDDASVQLDAAVDATEGDAETVDAFIADAFTGDEAAVLDAFVEAIDAFTADDAAAPDVELDAACARVEAAYADTTCNSDFFHCTFTSSTVSESSVAACEEAIAFGYSEVSGPPDRESRCTRAVSAMNECRE